MNKMLKALSFLALASGTQQVMAVPMDFDFNGNFTNDNDIVLLGFSVGADSTITIFSSSWDDGGLDPILAIWDSSGNLASQQDDGGSTGVQSSNGTDYDYGSWDSYFNVFLAAGSYTASIGMYNNFAVSNTLSDGFVHDSDPNFSAADGCSNGKFCGVASGNDNRTSDWAFHILNVDTASNVSSVPEPATLFLLGIGLAGLGFSRRKQA